MAREKDRFHVNNTLAALGPGLRCHRCLLLLRAAGTLFQLHPGKAVSPLGDPELPDVAASDKSTLSAPKLETVEVPSSSSNLLPPSPSRFFA